MSHEECLDIEVFDAVLGVYEVQSRTLTQGYANEPVGQRHIPGFPREEVFEVPVRDPD